MKEYFDIPIVLFIFLRKESTLQIIERLKRIRPKKIYILADAGRNDYEIQLAIDCRKSIENAIDWECEIIKNYAEENRGVFAQIGIGAKWVFEQEEKAIFLEDDNLPELTFFDYCKGALSKYEDSERILWICGTNYLEKCSPSKNASVFASKHLMPCGWASWSKKFLKYYDFDLQNMEYSDWKERLKEGYDDPRLYRQQLRNIEQEFEKKKKGERYRSWDYHMAFSIRINGLYGIVPKYNQIKNIGVDSFSTHGGNSMNLEMTRRFCGIETFPLDTPIVYPDEKDLDFSFERKIGNIILYPFKDRIILFFRDLFMVPDGVRLRNFLFSRGKNVEKK